MVEVQARLEDLLYRHPQERLRVAVLLKAVLLQAVLMLSGRRVRGNTMQSASCLFLGLSLTLSQNLSAVHHIGNRVTLHHERAGPQPPAVSRMLSQSLSGSRSL